MPHLSENELEYLSESNMIEIVPMFSMDTLPLISGEIGPIIANCTIEVPLWLALHLKKKRKCRIRPPQWLDADSLRKALESEKDEKDYLEKMPSQYLEIASSLIEVAPDDLNDVSQIKAHLAALESVREEKVRLGLQQFDSEFTYAKLTGISRMEILKIREYALNALDKFYAVSQESASERRTVQESQSQRRTQSQSQPIASANQERVRQLRDDDDDF